VTGNGTPSRQADRERRERAAAKRRLRLADVLPEGAPEAGDGQS
jgi:hypothetical protein